MSDRYGFMPPQREDSVRAAFRAASEIDPDPGERGLIWLSRAMAGRTGRMRSGGSVFFFKWSAEVPGRQALRAEFDGLRRLRAVCPDHVVEPVGCADAPDGSGTILVLGHVEQGTPAYDHDERLARALSGIHASTTDRYGLDQDNFIGATPQTNSQRTSWPEFFAEERLIAMAQTLSEHDSWPAHWTVPFEALVGRLPDLLPEQPGASLVHGDLWSGNVMTDSAGRPVLIDPAVYYGHAETDLAMMRLFGGFGSRVFDAYAEISGRNPGAPDRTAIYNLYHLLNHVLLFGSSYHGGVERTLRRFS